MFTTNVEEAQATVPVTILYLVGELDASVYLELIEQVKGLYAAGVRDLLLDLSELRMIASSGLVALHSSALIMRGKATPNLESGWGVLHTIAEDVDRRTEKESHFKLLNPQPRVQKALVTTGFDQTLAIYDDRDAALASFR